MSVKPSSGFPDKTALGFIARAFVLFAVPMILWHRVFPSYDAALIGMASGGLSLLQIRDRNELRSARGHGKLDTGVYHRDHASMRD